MIKCFRCSRPATLHITEIEKGVAKPVHLCQECAHAYMTGAHEHDESEEWGTGDIAATLESLSQVEESENLACHDCGLTFNAFRESGRLGCPGCYAAFRDELLPLLENIHSAVVHVGKRPRRLPLAEAGQAKLVRLRNRLQEAIRQEKYEDAAALRDEISEIEDRLNSDSSD